MSSVSLFLAILVSGGIGACAIGPATRGATDSGSAAPRNAIANLPSARELDQQGVRSFAEGRYADALRLFRTSRALGGPSSELWNVARCLERLDDAEGAAGVIEEYLSQSDLPAQDRAGAEREAQALRARPSILTVTTTPTGATVTVDGQQAQGGTPASVEIRPGAHTVVVTHAGYAVETRSVEARFGRGVIVALDLTRSQK